MVNFFRATVLFLVVCVAMCATVASQTKKSYEVMPITMPGRIVTPPSKPTTSRTSVPAKIINGTYQRTAVSSRTTPVKTVLVSETKKRDYTYDESQVYALINEERRKRRLTDMSWDSRLAQIARNYSGRMARENFFSHYDQNGDSVVARAHSMGVSGWRKLGENLFYCQGISEFDSFAVVNWMKSPAHRENILDRDWTATGIGIAEYGGRIYITQVFIQRR